MSLSRLVGLLSGQEKPSQYRNDGIQVALAWFDLVLKWTSVDDGDVVALMGFL